MSWRVWWQDYTGWRATRRSDPHPAKQRRDFGERAQAEAFKGELQRRPDVVATITPTPQRVVRVVRSKLPGVVVMHRRLTA